MWTCYMHACLQWFSRNLWCFIIYDTADIMWPGYSCTKVQGCASLLCRFIIIPWPGYFYRGKICECSPGTDVYLCDWSVFMVHWFCLSVQLITSLLRLIGKYRLWYNVSIPYPKPGLADNTGNVELGAAPLVQHYLLYHGLVIYREVTFVDVTSLSLGYATLIQCTALNCSVT